MSGVPRKGAVSGTTRTTELPPLGSRWLIPFPRTTTELPELPTIIKELPRTTMNYYFFKLKTLIIKTGSSVVPVVRTLQAQPVML